MFIAFGIQNMIQSGREVTLLVGDHTVWKYQDQRWDNVSSFQDLNWKKYRIYLNHENKGEYYLWYDDKWYAFDDDKNSFSLDGNLMAYIANYDLNVAYTVEDKITDTTYVSNVLKNHNISPSSQLTVSTKISFDFDQDGEQEDFYAISNAFALDFEPSVVFSFAFMVKNGSIYMIYEDVRTNDYFNGCKPYYTDFLDIDSDNQYEFIFSCGRYSMEEQIHILCQFSGDAFKTLISN